jgi:hypothetical protein
MAALPEKTHGTIKLLSDLKAATVHILHWQYLFLKRCDWGFAVYPLTT